MSPIHREYNAAAAADTTPGEGAAQASTYGTMSWAISVSFAIAGDSLPRLVESKKLLLQSIILLCTHVAPRQLDPTLILQLVDMVYGWLANPKSIITVREGVLVLQRFASMDGDPHLHQGAEPLWHKRFEEMMLFLCTSDTLSKVGGVRVGGGGGAGHARVCAAGAGGGVRDNKVGGSCLHHSPYILIAAVGCWRPLASATATHTLLLLCQSPMTPRRAFHACT
jgi:hypothetical protein